MENKNAEVPVVAGWGVDVDPQNDPTYPMKKRNDAEHAGYTWERPSQQATTVEVLHSNERPNVAAVFGTSTPPSGLSGMLRRLAFKYSESSYGHWLPLMLADRINSLEGLFDDIRQGYFPNIFAERGWGAEWKYNRAALIRRIAVLVVLLSAAIVLVRARQRRRLR